MSLSFQFAIASDLHIGLPHTIADNPYRFHRVELSIPIFEYVMDQLRQLDLDFLLIPGDLTQDGEPDNHRWLANALAQLPFPVYVIPGNHDAVQRERTATSIGIQDFPTYYEPFGYTTPTQLYYSCNPIPGVRLIGLNSVFYQPDGTQLYSGRLDEAQLEWLDQTLAGVKEGERVMVMVHHNVLEHLPHQSRSKLGQRYMLSNAPALVERLQAAGVQLVFTGHLHVQDVAYCPAASPAVNPAGPLAHTHDLFDITTGSFVSYPHPFRILRYSETAATAIAPKQAHLEIISKRIPSAPGWPDLQALSREFISDRSQRFIRRLLTDPPLNLTEADAEPLLPHLRSLWAEVANGDAQLDFSALPDPVQTYFEQYNATQLWDNQAVLTL